MNYNQIVNVVKTSKKTELVFDDGNTLTIGLADIEIQNISGSSDQLISIFPQIREREYRVLYSSSTLDKHGTSNAIELREFWETNNFFFDFGGSVIADGRVEFRADLPITIGVPVVGAIYIVEKPTTILFGTYTTYQSGFYIKDNDTGNIDNWRRLNVKIKFTDGEYVIVNSLDQSKQVKFDLSDITTNTTRILTIQDKDIVVADNADIWKVGIGSELGLINQQATIFEPFFIRESISNVDNTGTWTVIPPFTGQIKIDLHGRCSMNVTNSNILIHLLRDGTLFDFPFHVEPKDSAGVGISLPTVVNNVLGNNANTGTDQFIPFGGFKLIDVFQGVPITLRLEFSGQIADNEAAIYEAHINLERFNNLNL